MNDDLASIARDAIGKVSWTESEIRAALGTGGTKSKRFKAPKSHLNLVAVAISYNRSSKRFIADAAFWARSASSRPYALSCGSTQRKCAADMIVSGLVNHCPFVVKDKK